MNALQTIKESLLQLFYPHVCVGCGRDALPADSNICLHCLHHLPATGFEKKEDNPIEKLFYGRLPVTSASAQYYFTKASLMQRLMHEFKYNSNKDLGRQLGRLMGHQLQQSARFTEIEALIPLPLFADKEKKRGYNQSTILCKGIADVLHVKVIDDAIMRPMETETQTKKNRIERWKNMEGKFALQRPEKIMGKHVLLVDDVITTGATLESCGATLLQVPGLSLSIATLCYSKT